MIICLDDYQKKVLNRLLEISKEKDGKKRIHFKKSELKNLFFMDLDVFYDVVHSLKTCRFIDIPFQNKLQIDIYLYTEMIEEQLHKNKFYVKKHKDWMAYPVSEDATLYDLQQTECIYNEKDK